MSGSRPRSGKVGTGLRILRSRAASCDCSDEVTGALELSEGQPRRQRQPAQACNLVRTSGHRGGAARGRIEAIDDLGKVREGPDQARNLVNHDPVDMVGIDGVQQGLPSLKHQGRYRVLPPDPRRLLHLHRVHRRPCTCRLALAGRAGDHAHLPPRQPDLSHDRLRLPVAPLGIICAVHPMGCAPCSRIPHSDGHLQRHRSASGHDGQEKEYSGSRRLRRMARPPCRREAGWRCAAMRLGGASVGLHR